MNLLSCDLCVIGAGAGGLSVAAGAAQMGAKVVLIEHHKMGGDCLNYGCVPSKALLAAAKHAESIRHSAIFGIITSPPQVDYAQVFQHVQQTIAKIAPNDSVERFNGLGVTVLTETAQFIDSRQLTAGNNQVQAKRFVIATGSSPAIPNIEGLKQVHFLTNETIFNLTELPSHLIVIGGGPIGCELGQAFLMLGAKVTLLASRNILPKDDPECVQIVRGRFLQQGMNLHETVLVTKVEPAANGMVVHFNNPDGSLHQVSGSHLLIATGRNPQLVELNLEKAGVAFNSHGIQVDKHLRSTNKRIFAIGDVAGGYQFTHLANYHASIVIRNALFHWPAKVDYHALPWVTYTSPELAHVGLNESQATVANLSYRKLILPYAEVDRMQTERETEGLIKILTSHRGKILGVTLVGSHAGELIAPWVLAMHRRLKISALATMIAAYPTRSEINKRAAGTFYIPTLFSKRTRHLVRLLNW